MLSPFRWISSEPLVHFVLNCLRVMVSPIVNCCISLTFSFHRMISCFFLAVLRVILVINPKPPLSLKKGREGSRSMSTPVISWVLDD